MVRRKLRQVKTENNITQKQDVKTNYEKQIETHFLPLVHITFNFILTKYCSLTIAIHHELPTLVRLLYQFYPARLVYRNLILVTLDNYVLVRYFPFYWCHY